jgi:hypothetical protein
VGNCKFRPGEHTYLGKYSSVKHAAASSFWVQTCKPVGIKMQSCRSTLCIQPLPHSKTYYVIVSVPLHESFATITLPFFSRISELQRGKTSNVYRRQTARQKRHSPAHAHVHRRAPRGSSSGSQDRRRRVLLWRVPGQQRKMRDARINGQLAAVHLLPNASFSCTMSHAGSQHRCSPTPRSRPSQRHTTTERGRGSDSLMASTSQVSCVGGLLE